MRTLTLALFFIVLTAPFQIIFWLGPSGGDRSAVLLDTPPNTAWLILVFLFALAASWWLMRWAWNKPKLSSSLVFVFVFAAPSLVMLSSNLVVLSLVTATTRETHIVPVTVRSADRVTKDGAKGAWRHWFDVSNPIFPHQTLSLIDGYSQPNWPDDTFHTRVPAPLRAPGALACIAVGTGIWGIRWAAWPAPCTSDNTTDKPSHAGETQRLPAPATRPTRVHTQVHG